MSQARLLANLIDTSGDIVSGALDNVPASNDASALTTGTLPVNRTPYLTNRNFIINGSFAIAQRGTSFTDADTYALDRWRLNQSSETMAVTQQSFTAGQTDVPRAEKYLRVVVSTTGNFAGITQRIEGVEQLSGQTVTVSFYARGGQGGQGVPTTFRTYLNQNFGSGGSTAVNVQGETSHTLTTSWQLFTATVTLGSTSGKTIGTSSYTELAFQQTTGEACDFDIALVQLEIGNTATPFEHRSYGNELASCQRYYHIAYCAGSGVQNSGTQAFVVMQLPTTMRDRPTLSTNSGVWTNINLENDDTYDITNASVSHGSTSGDPDSMTSFILGFTTSGSNTSGYGIVAVCDRNSDFFIFDAEL